MDYSTDGIFQELLLAIAKDDREGAKKLVPGLRARLDRLDPDDLDETMDWFSEKVLEIKDAELFDKTLEFLVNNELAE